MKARLPTTPPIIAPRERRPLDLGIEINMGIVEMLNAGIMSRIREELL